MTDNNKFQETAERVEQKPKPPRKALGRGLQAILASQGEFGESFETLPEHVKAARIGAAILELMDAVEARYQPVIFKSVAAYRAVSDSDSQEVVQASERLRELDRERRIRIQDAKPKRRWWNWFWRSQSQTG